MTQGCLGRVEAKRVGKRHKVSAVGRSRREAPCATNPSRISCVPPFRF